MIESLVIFALVVLFLVREYSSYKEKQQLMAERSELLNRIKPETAVISNLELPEMVEPVRSDEDYWASHESQIKKEGTYPYGYEEEARGR